MVTQKIPFRWDKSNGTDDAFAAGCSETFHAPKTAIPILDGLLRTEWRLRSVLVLLSSLENRPSYLRASE
jgi:hypothetical protein